MCVLDYHKYLYFYRTVYIKQASLYLLKTLSLSPQ